MMLECGRSVFRENVTQPKRIFAVSEQVGVSALQNYDEQNSIDTGKSRMEMP